jgi:hypothetical protein
MDLSNTHLLSGWFFAHACTHRMLDLSNNALGEKSAAALASSLATNLKLVDLNLSWNQFRPKGVVQLAEGLKPNLSLQLLGLAWCGMADGGAEAFGEMLALNQVRACQMLLRRVTGSFGGTPASKRAVSMWTVLRAPAGLLPRLKTPLTLTDFGRDIDLCVR